MILLRRLLGDVLRRQRQRQGRTLREVSSSARVSLGYLSEVERGQKEASSELLAAICDALDVRMSELMREVSDELALAELAQSAAARAGISMSVVTQGVCSVRPRMRDPVMVEGPRLGESPEVRMNVVKSPLSDTDLKTVADALQGALVDLVDLALVAKQVHWNVVGPRFRSVHLQLDEVVDTARTHSDTVAERASALGVSPDGRASTVASRSGIQEVAGGWVKDEDAVRVLVQALGAVITRMRERVSVTEEPDPVSQDILIGITADLEKHHWMFQAENV
ncbi:DNA protection during starvation protein [Streptomyces glaucescens]